MLADKYQYKEFCQILRGGGGVPKVYTKTDPNIHITKCKCSLILRPKGRAETFQLTYSCQLLAVYIQYKHIYYNFLIKVYCVKYKVLDICFWHLENTFQLNLYSVIEHILPTFGGYMSFGGFLSRGPTVRGPIVHFFKVDSWAPDSRAPGPSCPGPNCPLFQSGHSGPGQLGPGAQLSIFWGRTIGPSCPGPNCLGPKMPRTQGSDDSWSFACCDVFWHYSLEMSIFSWTVYTRLVDYNKKHQCQIIW